MLVNTKCQTGNKKLRIISGLFICLTRGLEEEELRATRATIERNCLIALSDPLRPFDIKKRAGEEKMGAFRSIVPSLPLPRILLTPLAIFPAVLSLLIASYFLADRIDTYVSSIAR